MSKKTNTSTTKRCDGWNHRNGKPALHTQKLWESGKMLAEIIRKY